MGRRGASSAMDVRSLCQSSTQRRKNAKLQRSTIRKTLPQGKEGERKSFTRCRLRKRRKQLVKQSRRKKKQGTSSKRRLSSLRKSGMSQLQRKRTRRKNNTNKRKRAKEWLRKRAQQSKQ